MFFHILLTDAAYSDENVHLHFPKGAECRQKMIAKYLSRHLLQRCRVWAEISASASYLLMHDMGGNFRLHFFTIARCGQKFPSAFYLTMETIGRKFCPHFPDDGCRMIAKSSSVSIFQIDTEYQRKTRSVSSPMQNVGANFRQHFPHKSKIQSNLYITALYIAVTLYIISHWATSQNFQLPYIFCKVDLYIVVTLYIMEPKRIVELHAF